MSTISKRCYHIKYLDGTEEYVEAEQLGYLRQDHTNGHEQEGSVFDFHDRVNNKGHAYGRFNHFYYVNSAAIENIRQLLPSQSPHVGATVIRGEE